MGKIVFPGFHFFLGKITFLGSLFVVVNRNYIKLYLLLTLTEYCNSIPNLLTAAEQVLTGICPLAEHPTNMLSIFSRTQQFTPFLARVFEAEAPVISSGQFI